MSTIYWAGDSTVQTNDFTTYPQTGIGQVFELFIREGNRVVNYARNGRSSKSFLEEGRLAQIEKRIEPGDFLFIQFGHNDEKQHDETRYTEPFGSFIEYLGKYVLAATEHGAYPVLITPLERRWFQDEKHLQPGEHGDYVAGMKLAAQKYQVPLVDLNKMSREDLETVGEERSRGWYMFFDAGYYPEHPEESRDNTHLRHDGAVHFAGLIARQLRAFGGVYNDLLLDDLHISDVQES